MNFFTNEFLIQAITSFIASSAFAVIFKTNKRHLLQVSFAGLMTYVVYYTALYFNSSLFIAALLSTCVASLFGEICARISHAPAIIFIIAGIIPIVPGGDAYYSIKYLMEGNRALALQKLASTGQVALGIASGIVFLSILIGIYTDFVSKRKKQKNKKQP